MIWPKFYGSRVPTQRWGTWETFIFTHCDCGFFWISLEPTSHFNVFLCGMSITDPSEFYLYVVCLIEGWFWIQQLLRYRMFVLTCLAGMVWTTYKLHTLACCHVNGGLCAGTWRQVMECTCVNMNIAFHYSLAQCLCVCMRERERKFITSPSLPSSEKIRVTS